MIQERTLDIDLTHQRLRLLQGAECVAEYLVSTARNGPGERLNSECTPRGWHAIGQKIGAGAAPGTVFVGRVPTGEVWSPAFAATQAPGRDWILTRILWLEGLEPGVNAGGEVDSRARYIYLHGTPDTAVMGVPGSRGCVRMRNVDIIELFDRVVEGDRVLLHE